MSGIRLERWDQTRDGAPTEAALRALLAAEGYAVTRYDYAPGTHFPPHTHATDKCDVVLAGEFEIASAGGAHVLGPGDRVYVPAGVEHEARVCGADTVVSLDGVLRGR